MTKPFISLSILMFAYFIYGFYISQSEFSIFNPSLKTPEEDTFYDYKGIINVHSDLSIGSSPLNQIISAAKLTKLDFILFSDLNVFNPPYLFEGYHEKTLVLMGQKISYLDSRFITYSLNREPLGSNLGEAQVKLADLLSQKVNKDHLIILTHPKEKSFNWTGDLPQGIDGFELVNLKTISNKSWEISKFSILWSFFIYPFNASLSLIRIFNEPTEEINLFDTAMTTNSKIYYGYTGAEASARAIPIANYLIKFPSYQKTFEIFSNHILLKSELTGNAKTDRVKIFQALKNGNFYLAFDLLGKTNGFECYMVERNKTYLMGSTVKKSNSLSLKIKIPIEPTSFYEVVLYKNGVRHQTFNKKEIDVPIKEAGRYRAQVRVSPYLPLPDSRKWITWIYSNPFNVVD